MMFSMLRSETGDATTRYVVLRTGRHFFGFARVQTPDGVRRTRPIWVTGHIGRVQRRVTAIRTGYLWIWASSAEVADLAAQVEQHAEILATSRKHPESQRLAAQCMAAEEVAKVAAQALRQWHGVSVPRARKTIAAA